MFPIFVCTDGHKSSDLVSSADATKVNFTDHAGGGLGNSSEGLSLLLSPVGKLITTVSPPFQAALPLSSSSTATCLL